jgi:hypothetical protein
MKDKPIIAPGPPLLCATAGCPYEAKVRRRVDARWMNLCCACDDRHMRSENLGWCIEHGLDTAEKQKAFCRKVFDRWRRQEFSGSKIIESAPIPSL